MMKTHVIAAGLAAAGAVVLLSGCASSQSARMYVLSSPDDIAAQTDISPRLDGASIGVTRVRIPKHLARPPIVTDRNEVELALSEFHYWGQPLADNLGDVLVVNLSGLLPDSTVLLERTLYDLQPGYLVHLEVFRLSGALGRQAELEARWGIRRAEDGAAMISGINRYTRALQADGHGPYVAALNDIMMEVSRAIAADLNALAHREVAEAAETP